jgi:outer membrane cobalamin receptor
MLGEWGFRSGWTLNASTGVSHQLPDLHQLTAEARSADLVAERATHLEAGIEQRPTQTLRWQATFFARRENNVLREPDVYPRLVATVPTAPGGYVNALRGSSRGIELLVDRYSASGFSGWASYSFGRSRYTDTERLQTFPADFDQRHAFNLFGAYRFANGASVGGTYRAGSNFPLSGYFARRDGGLFVGDRRNQVRLPVFSRLDLRGDFRFASLGRHLTIFGEVLNVLDRGNAGRANGTVNPLTGEATGFIDMLFRRRASAGILIEF